MDFWYGKRVLLTGHTGFKGSWLALWLQSLQAELTGIALDPPTQPNLFEIANVSKGMNSIRGNLSDLTLLKNIMRTCQPEIVIHLAAQALVRYSYEAPLETYTSNVMGTVNVLEAARLSRSVKAIIVVTSDKCYEIESIEKAYKENDRLGGYDPYSNSKACAELVTQAYRNAYFKKQGIGLATVRAGNVIGGGDWSKDRIVPDIIKACINQKTVSLRFPKALRPWQHVLEPLNGYLMLAKRLYQLPFEYSDSWNFGPEEECVKPVSWLTDTILTLWNASNRWVADDASHPYEAATLKLNSTKAQVYLGWKPLWKIDDALKKTVEWYQDYQTKKDMHHKTLLQIKEFIDMSYSKISVT